MYTQQILFLQNGRRELKFKSITLEMHANSTIDIHPTSIVLAERKKRELTFNTNSQEKQQITSTNCKYGFGRMGRRRRRRRECLQDTRTKVPYRFWLILWHAGDSLRIL